MRVVTHGVLVIVNGQAYPALKVPPIKYTCIRSTSPKNRRSRFLYAQKRHGAYDLEWHIQYGLPIPELLDGGNGMTVAKADVKAWLK